MVAVASPQDLQEALRRTVQQKGDVTPRTFILQLVQTAENLPRWWTPARDGYLRKFFPSEPYLAGALYSVCARNASFRIEFSGPEGGVKDAYKLLATANLFKGWETFSLKVSLDLYTQDNGAFIELIRPARVQTEEGETKAINLGNTWAAVGRDNRLYPLVGRDYKLLDSPLDLPIGLNHLDAARCVRTGDPETPVVYTDIKGVQHELKWYQVVTLEDMPSAEESMNDVGYCATSRAFRLAETLRDMLIYRQEKVAGRFAGDVWLTNVPAAIVQDAIDDAAENADNQGLTRYAPPIIAHTYDPGSQPAAVRMALASLPENFDEEVAMRWYIAGLALDLGVDYGFLAPLPGNKLGTSQQAEVAERQSRGKASRLYMSQIEQAFNYRGILPRNVWMEYKEIDAREEMERDTASGRRADTRAARIASGEITPAIARQIAVDDGDLQDEYLEMMGEEDVTPTTRRNYRRGWGKVPRDLAKKPQDEMVEGEEAKAVKQVEYKNPEYEDLLDANDTYTNTLIDAYDKWAKKWAQQLGTGTVSRVLPKLKLRQAMDDLVRELQAVTALLSSAYLLGYSGRTLTPTGEAKVQQWAMRNERYLRTSLVPAIRAELEELDEWTVALLATLLAAYVPRVALYAQPHWVLIWEGMAERARKITVDTGITPRVVRYLDQSVEKHCSTCPPKAKEYASWDEMLTFCGGLPGGGSDECLANCRCWLAVMV